MASTVKFDTWQNTAGELIADTAAGARLPLSGNAIINGDFGVWQRGTTFNAASSSDYFADRWFTSFNGTGATRNITQESFTPADVNAVGYGDAEFFLRYDQTVAGSGATFTNLSQRIEDVRSFAGQDITVSFWAKADSAFDTTVQIGQYFGSGGSTAVYTNSPTFTVGTSWSRISATVSVPSISGKTITSGTYLWLILNLPINTTFTFDVWGVQLEAGSVATPFRLAGGGSKAAELALCQRYCQVYNESTGGVLAPGFASLTYRAPVAFRFPEMRVAPSGAISASSDFEYIHRATATTCSSGPGFNETTTTSARLQADVASGLTQGDGVILRFVSGSGGTLTLDAEL